MYYIKKHVFYYFFACMASVSCMTSEVSRQTCLVGSGLLILLIHCGIIHAFGWLLSLAQEYFVGVLLSVLVQNIQQFISESGENIHCACLFI